MSGGSWSQLGSTAESDLTSGDTLRVEVSGTTISPYINGSQTGTPGDQSDPGGIASGYAGITGYSTGGGNGDNFEGGNLGSTPDTLTSTNIVSGNPISGEPSLGQTHGLASTNVVIDNPILGEPVIGSSGTDNLLSDDIFVSIPFLGEPAFAQEHKLTADSVFASIPFLGEPTVTEIPKSLPPLSISRRMMHMLVR